MDILKADVLVVGGGTGGTAAAIQAARRGANTILVSPFPWLGGMLTAAGVSAPDGNELVAFQTGMWGAFLRALRQRQPEGLDHAWVSFFTFDPRVGASIFAEWANALPNLKWIPGQEPVEVLKQGDRIQGVRFNTLTIEASITIDGTELGDVLALGEVPYRWGWEWRSQWQEPSAPDHPNALTQRYPVQAPTWVVVMQDFGKGVEALEIPPTPFDLEGSTQFPYATQFQGTWEGYGPEHFLNYGRLPGDRFMINFPQQGNDYGVGLDRLIQSSAQRLEFLQEARWHTQSYARFLQSQLGRRYGLASDIFPTLHSDSYSSPLNPHSLGGGAFALYPYYRESRRLEGLVTVTEADILPQQDGQVAVLPVDDQGRCTAIALGNYANDHHYPGYDFPLTPKSMQWGGRWTGTPFALPYGCLVPKTMDGLLVCEKNISVSHIANGATRLQPVVLGLGQAAGMAAALCIEYQCQPRDLPVSVLQTALLEDPTAPAAMIPLLNSSPEHPHWRSSQRWYLEHPETYPKDGYSSRLRDFSRLELKLQGQHLFIGRFQHQGLQRYALQLSSPHKLVSQPLGLVTLHSEVDAQLRDCVPDQSLKVWGYLNRSGHWILVDWIE